MSTITSPHHDTCPQYPHPRSIKYIIMTSHVQYPLETHDNNDDDDEQSQLWFKPCSTCHKYSLEVRLVCIDTYISPLLWGGHIIDMIEAITTRQGQKTVSDIMRSASSECMLLQCVTPPPQALQAHLHMHRPYLSHPLTTPPPHQSFRG